MPLKGAILHLAEPEYLAVLRQEKWWRRREAEARQMVEPKRSSQQVEAT